MQQHGACSNPAFPKNTSFVPAPLDFYGPKRGLHLGMLSDFILPSAALS